MTEYHECVYRECVCVCKCVCAIVCVCVCVCECVCMSVSVSESVRVFVDFCVGGEEGLLVYAHIPYRAIHDGLRSLPGRGRVWKKNRHLLLGGPRGKRYGVIGGL